MFAQRCSIILTSIHLPLFSHIYLLLSLSLLYFPSFKIDKSIFTVRAECPGLLPYVYLIMQKAFEICTS